MEIQAFPNAQSESKGNPFKPTQIYINFALSNETMPITRWRARQMEWKGTGKRSFDIDWL